MQNLIAIVGNTGVGKSQLAVELAKHLNGEVINGDSMQMYKGLDIITNKHPIDQQEGIPHHLLGHTQWEDQYSVQQFEAETVNLIDDMAARGKVPIVVGGTHYYIQALMAENSTIGQRDAPTRKMSSEEEATLDDPAKVEAKLREIDPVISAKFHPNDTRRLRRALEIYYTTGQLASEIYQTQADGSMKLRYRVLVFWIYCDREVLNARLDARVDSMMEQGLMTELKEMYEVYKTMPGASQGIWQVLGFRQFLPFLDGRDETIDKSLEAMKSETRQYAKKQSKWIVNKLTPLLKKLGGTMAILDSSDLSHWQANVGDRAVSIAGDWLAHGKIKEKLVPEHIDAERKQQEFGRDQWVRYRCEPCSVRRGVEVVVMGDDAWKTHLASKAHRKQRAWLDGSRGSTKSAEEGKAK